MIKEWFYSILVTVVGVGMLIIGFSTMSSADATCGSQKMEAGDICHDYKSGKDSDIDEVRSENRSTSYWLLGLGAAMSIGGVVWIVANANASSRRRAAARPAPAPAPVGFGPLPQNFSPPQNFAPPQHLPPAQQYQPAPQYQPAQQDPPKINYRK